MSTRRQDRRRQERHAKASKVRQSTVATRTKTSFLGRLSADWIIGGIIAGVVLIIGAVFGAAYFFSPGRSAAAPLFSQIFSLAVSPDKPGTLLLGDAGGLYVSTNSGKKWTPQGSLGAVHKAFFDPNNPSTAYIIGGSTIQKSKDGGETWTLLRTNLPQGQVTSLASDPSDSSELYVFVAGQGLYKSENSGSTWTRKNTLQQATLSSLAVKAGAPDTIFAFHDADGFVVSRNGGAHFEAAGGSGLPRTSVSDVLTFAQEPETLFVAANQSVYKSINGGSAWTKLDSTGIHGVAVVALTRDSKGTVYATDTQGQIFTSSDGGAAWQQAAS